MPMMRQSHLLCCLLLYACTQPKVSFYDQPYEQQMMQAQTMPTSELYELYKEAFDRPPPPLTHLSDELGKRGEEVLDLWLDDLVKHGALANEWEFADLLRALRQRSGVSICSYPAKLETAASTLAKSRGATKENMTRLLKQYC